MTCDGAIVSSFVVIISACPFVAHQKEHNTNMYTVYADTGRGSSKLGFEHVSDKMRTAWCGIV